MWLALGAIGGLCAAAGINTAVTSGHEVIKLATGETAGFEDPDGPHSGSCCRHASMLTVRATGEDRVDIDVVDALFGARTSIEDEAAAGL